MAAASKIDRSDIGVVVGGGADLDDDADAKLFGEMDDIMNEMGLNDDNDDDNNDGDNGNIDIHADDDDDDEIDLT